MIKIHFEKVGDDRFNVDIQEDVIEEVTSVMNTYSTEEFEVSYVLEEKIFDDLLARKLAMDFATQYPSVVKTNKAVWLNATVRSSRTLTVTISLVENKLQGIIYNTL